MPKTEEDKRALREARRADALADASYGDWRAVMMRGYELLPPAEAAIARTAIYWLLRQVEQGINMGHSGGYNERASVALSDAFEDLAPGIAALPSMKLWATMVRGDVVEDLPAEDARWLIEFDGDDDPKDVDVIGTMDRIENIVQDAYDKHVGGI